MREEGLGDRVPDLDTNFEAAATRFSATRFLGFLNDTNYPELLLRLHEVISLDQLFHDVLRRPLR